jgi:hypothetical protein
MLGLKQIKYGEKIPLYFVVTLVTVLGLTNAGVERVVRKQGQNDATPHPSIILLSL